jgi:hypothetical protein
MANKTGQTLPLKDRLNAYQQGKRQLKIQARRTVAEALGRGLNGVAYQVLHHQKRQTLHVRLLWVMLVILAMLLGYHVHIHPGL